MSGPADHREDLRYVREVVERAEGTPSPASIYYLWALLCLVGFPLVDLAPRSVGLYWMFAGPLGFLASAFLGWRFSRATGQVSRREGYRVMLHWLGTLVAIALATLLVASDALHPADFGRVVLLLLALSYYMSGLHQFRPLLWMGLLLAAAYVVVGFVEQWAWTIVGVVVAVSMVVAGRQERMRAEA